MLSITGLCHLLYRGGEKIKEGAGEFILLTIIFLLLGGWWATAVRHSPSSPGESPR